MDRLILDLKKNGFVNAGRLGLTNIEIDELANLSRQIFDSVRDANYSADKHPDYISPIAGGEGVRRFPQLNLRVAELLDKVVSDDDVQAILNAVLGSGYKIWQVNYRRSSSGDQGLSLHQDSFGETNLCIMLGNNSFGDGATLFLAGSHLVPTRMKKWGVGAPSFLFRWLGPLFSRLTGKAGDVSFFFNRTWHGRSPNSTHSAFDVILFSFFPPGGSFGYEGYGEWSTDFLRTTSGTTLGALIDPSLGTQKLEGGRYKVLNSSKSESVSFATGIEYSKMSKRGLDNYKLNLKILLLRFMYLFQPLLRLARAFRGKI